MSRIIEVEYPGGLVGGGTAQIALGTPFSFAVKGGGNLQIKLKDTFVADSDVSGFIDVAGREFSALRNGDTIEVQTGGAAVAKTKAKEPGKPVRFHFACRIDGKPTVGGGEIEVQS